MSDDDELYGSPGRALGRKSPKVGVKKFGRPEENNGDKRGWSHFEFMFVIWFNFCTMLQRIGWLKRRRVRHNYSR